MIAVNWGTTNFRAYKLDAQGHVEAEKLSDRGAVNVPPGGFQDALTSEVLEWMDGSDNRILMCGMVGARRGWKEAPYVPVPATFEQIVKGVIQLEVEGLDVRIVPGLIGKDSNGLPDVLRGEETEVLGCKSESAGNVQYCLPGTHTKWLRMEGGRLGSFWTSMTGDLFRAIRTGTILRSCTQHAPNDEKAFLMGVARAGQGGELGHQLFGVRTQVLTGDMKDTAASSYLSGLLIGNEVKNISGKDGRIHLIGDEKLCLLYQKALLEFGMIATMEPEGAALRGLLRISRSLKW